MAVCKGVLPDLSLLLTSAKYTEMMSEKWTIVKLQEQSITVREMAIKKTVFEVEFICKQIEV